MRERLAEIDAEYKKKSSSPPPPELSTEDRRFDNLGRTFENRLIREAVKEAVLLGKSRVAFPTKETLMAIEDFESAEGREGVLKKYEELPGKLAKFYGRENVSQSGGWVYLELTDVVKGMPTVYYQLAGQHLPPHTASGRGMTAKAVSDIVNKLNASAANASPVRVVQSFGDLPQRVRRTFRGNENTLEGAYDPDSRTTWFVADNLTDDGRVAEVWAHEQVVHNGLRGMLSPGERRRLMNRLWHSVGGMGNKKVNEIAKRYGLNPRGNESDRVRVMEEVVASMAERRANGLLTAQEQTLWRRIVSAIKRALDNIARRIAGRDSRFSHDNIDALLADLGRYVMEGIPAGVSGSAEGRAMASLSGDKLAAAHAAWEQVRRDTEEWGRQLDDWKKNNEAPSNRTLRVGMTPDVLKKLGAKTQIMAMMPRNMDKVHNNKKIPLDVLKRLPEALANPLMVFKSATMADSLVVLTELEHNGENLIAAIHLNVEHGRMTINDIASVHDRAVKDENGKVITPGWQWFKGQIEKGNLRYYDKNRSSRWFREHSGLQLPGVINRESYRGTKILTEKDIVKPVAPEFSADEQPLASLGNILNFGVKGAARVADMPQSTSLLRKSDIGLMKRIAYLPHFIAKEYPKFKAVYDRQLQRMDERAKGLVRSMAEVPSLFGKDRLKKEDMDSLRKILWETEGKDQKALEGVEKFLADGKLANGRTRLKANPKFYDAYKKWADGLGGTAAARDALLEIRKCLDSLLVMAYNRMAEMRELDDDAIKAFRQERQDEGRIAGRSKLHQQHFLWKSTMMPVCVRGWWSKNKEVRQGSQHPSGGLCLYQTDKLAYLVKTHCMHFLQVPRISIQLP
jgi:hypothetical protein